MVHVCVGVGSLLILFSYFLNGYLLVNYQLLERVLFILCVPLSIRRSPHNLRFVLLLHELHAA